MHHIYLGYYSTQINSQGVYCNFYSLFEYQENQFVNVQDEIKEVYSHGNIAVFYNNSFNQQEQFLHNGEFCVIEFLEGDIHTYTNPQGLTKHKCYLEDLFNKEQVYALSDYGIYPIVEGEFEDIDFAKNNIITIKQKFPINHSMKKVLLQNRNTLYGPFDVDLRTHDQKLYINTHIKEFNYLIAEIDDNNISRNVDPILPLPNRFGYDLYIKYEQAKQIVVDVISDEVIQNCIKSADNTEYNQQKLLDNLPAGVLERRKNKITQIILNQDNANFVSDLLYDKILSVLLSSDSDKQKQDLIEAIFSRPEAVLKLQSSKIVIEKIDEIRKELELLGQERDALRQENLNLQLHAQELEEQELINRSKALQQICDQIDNKSKELDVLAKKLGLATDIDKLQARVAAANSEHRAATEHTLEVKREAQDAIRQASSSISTAVRNSLDKKLFLSINDVLNEEKKETEAHDYDMIVAHINQDIVFCDKQGADLINYIVSEVQKRRPDYDYNFIVNILISIRQNFITFFAGPPGTGKTSICHIIADVLGLNNPLLFPANLTKDINCTAFAAVSVERGWNTKKDFIGYYNPLSKNIEKNNSDIIDLLKISGNNDENSLPALILLDEANLSPLEYYWSDFVGISDDIDRRGRNIDLGNGHKLNIAPTVRFVATMNSDHTVEKLSPRIIDRTSFITLPQPQDIICDNETQASNYLPVNWNNFYKALSSDNKQFLPIEKNIFTDLKAIFDKMKSPLAARTRKSMENYCLIARELFKEESGLSSEMVAIDYAILQKILPKISGAGMAYKQALDELLDLCKKNGFCRSESMLMQILESGNESLVNSYDYFA